MDVQCFFLAKTNLFRRSLRRFTYCDDNICRETPCGKYGHDASMILIPSLEIPDLGEMGGRGDDEHPHDDPHWPVHCQKCEYKFLTGDEWQRHDERLYRRSDNGELTTLQESPVGALYYADWLGGHQWRGPDGHVLYAKCPDGHTWNIDSRANNCTLPHDDIHRCWVRHGEVPNITVDKCGITCTAGAGSIQTANWHGFLRDGRFVTA